MKGSSVIAPLLTLVATIAVIVVTVRQVLRLPGIPYNVQELFLDHASLSALVFFALTLLWIGAGAMLVAHVLVWSRRAYLILPLALILVSLVSKMLLSRSVTYESVDDIIGTNNLFGLVTRENVWGAAWKHAFDALGLDLVDFFERRVRYTALYSIPLLGIASTLVLAARPAHAGPRKSPLDLSLLIVCMAGWLWLARTLVMTWAATDNLTELIAQHSMFGFAGEWYLVAIPILMGVNVVLLSRAAAHPTWWPSAIASAIVALPIGWALLNLGLEPHVEKYGSVFSGAQFLLGPDRRHGLSESALFARWAAVYAGAVGVTFIGAWITHRIVPTALGVGSTSRPGKSAGAAS
jgi:hypothetical protein